MFTIVRLITEEDGDLTAYVDLIVESEDGIDGFSLKQILINDHTADNRGITRGYLLLNIFSVFVNRSRK